MSEIRAIIFDMDGVLINAKDWHYDALNKALGHYGYEITRQEHLDIYDGNPTLTKLRLLSEAKGLPTDLHEKISILKQEYTQQIARSRCCPYPQHQMALSRLKSEGYRLALCSNSVRDSVDIMMQLSELEEYLEFSISNQDVSNAKPDPEMYMDAIARLRLLPGQCLILEDNDKGIRAARASGAHVMIIETIADVSYRNIEQTIARISAGQADTKDALAV